jgi:hypothetical protein
MKKLLASSRSTDLLPVFDQAMQSRVKGVGARCQTGT